MNHMSFIALSAVIVPFGFLVLFKMSAKTRTILILALQTIRDSAESMICVHNVVAALTCLEKKA